MSTRSRRALIATAAALLIGVAAGAVVVADSPVSESNSDTPKNSEAPAIADASPNPWEINSPAWALRFLEDYCPGSPPLSREMVDEINAALRACVLGRVVISGGHVPRQ
jgi:hypothetical protein